MRSTRKAWTPHDNARFPVGVVPEQLTTLTQRE
jgi:hypothetical protein